MNFGSVCSGIEAASVAWNPLGWKAQFLSEIEPFPSAVLAHRHPEVPNLGDMTKFKEWKSHDIDVLVGGTPCQSFSVAGLRKGLADPRGNLMLTYLAIADKYRPDWLVWENVPGVLSSNGGKDFGTFLGGLGELGYGFAYRVLDAQHFGVPQRRRRVFVIGCLGDWRLAAAVLFERHSLQGNPTPSRKTGQEVASTLRTGTPGSGGQGTDWEQVVGLTMNGSDVYPTLDRTSYEKGWCNQAVSQGLGVFFRSSGQTNAETLHEQAPTLTRNGDMAPFINAPSYGIPGNWIGRKPENGGNATAPMRDVAPRLTKTDQHGVQSGTAVRRLTPRECERLQGFPDDYTQVPYRNKSSSDGPRYKALGNSMAVPVMAWIGSRINAVAGLKAAKVAA